MDDHSFAMVAVVPYNTITALSTNLPYKTLVGNPSLQITLKHGDKAGPDINYSEFKNLFFPTSHNNLCLGRFGTSLLEKHRYGSSLGRIVANVYIID